MAEEKLNLFQFASTTVAQACASAAQIVGCQIANAGLPGASLYRVPDYVTRARFELVTFCEKPLRVSVRHEKTNAGAKSRDRRETLELFLVKCTCCAGRGMPKFGTAKAPTSQSSRRRYR